MALTDTTRDYEILVRFREDGTAAAHRQQIREIRDADGLVSATELPPEPISIADAAALLAQLTAQI